MVEVSVYCCLQTGEPEMCNKVGLNSVNQKTTPWYNTYPIIMTVHPLNYDAEWRPKKIKSIPNIREAQKMMREKEMPAPNLWPPCIPVPLVWCSHEHMIPCLIQGNMLKTELNAWIPVERHCRKGCHELQLQISVSNMCASREKLGEKSLQCLCIAVFNT